MKVLCVGGGTAGHVLPAVPVMERLMAQDHEVAFVGTRSGLERSLLAETGIEVHEIHAGKLRRYWSWQNVTDIGRILLGVVQALVLLVRLKPAVVFSKGGFVSFPVALAAWMTRVPVVAHESDLTPGLANRLVSRFVKTLCVSFPETQVARAMRVVHSGTPIRPAMLHGDAARGRTLLGLESTAKLLVVTGGSLGADTLNATVREDVERLTSQYTVLHVCGPGKVVPLDIPDYVQREFVEEGWGDILAAADVVVSRAGANALFELLALGKLNVLVPLSAEASRGDQIENARYAERRGYSVVIAQEHLSADELWDALTEVEARRSEIEAALGTFVLPDAAQVIVDEIEAACRAPAT